MNKPKSNRPQVKLWLYYPAYWLCRFLAKVIFGLKITGQESIPKDGPLLVMCSHQGMMDFLLVLASMKGRVAQFVATQRQFQYPLFRWVYTRLGVIPKVQFNSDPRCVMNILRVLKSNGTIVLFPAGQTSMWGVPGDITPAMAHLAKRAGAPVLTVSLRGGYFTAPRMGGLHFGRTEARLKLAFTAQQLKSLSEEEIFRTLQEQLYFDEYAWQEETGVTFRGKNLAEGYDQVLLLCPKCGAQGSWTVRENTVTCTACGNRGRLGRDMHLAPVGPEDRVFPTLKEWGVWQEKQLEEAMERPDFLLELPVECHLYEEGTSAYRKAGQGVLRLDRQEIRYEGTVDGQELRLENSHAQHSGLSTTPGEYVEMYHQGYGLVRYVSTEKAMMTAMKMAQEARHRQIKGE